MIFFPWSLTQLHHPSPVTSSPGFVVLWDNAFRTTIAVPPGWKSSPYLSCLLCAMLQWFASHHPCVLAGNLSLYSRQSQAIFNSIIAIILISCSSINRHKQSSFTVPCLLFGIPSTFFSAIWMVPGGFFPKMCPHLILLDPWSSTGSSEPGLDQWMEGSLLFVSLHRKCRNLALCWLHWVVMMLHQGFLRGHQQLFVLMGKESCWWPTGPLGTWPICQVSNWFCCVQVGELKLALWVELLWTSGMWQFGCPKCQSLSLAWLLQWAVFELPWCVESILNWLQSSLLKVNLWQILHQPWFSFIWLGPGPLCQFPSIVCQCLRLPGWASHQFCSGCILL